MTSERDTFFQRVLDFIDDIGSFVTYGAAPNSQELRIMDEIDANPSADIDTLIEQSEGWLKVNRKRLMEYRSLRKSHHAQTSP